MSVTWNLELLLIKGLERLTKYSLLVYLHYVFAVL